MLDELVAELAALRAKRDAAREKQKEQLAIAIATPEYIEYDRFLTLARQADEIVDNAEDRLRAAAVKQYQSDKAVAELMGDKPDKKIHAAVEIQMFQVLEYKPEDAYEYCLEHLTSALSLDKKAFENIAKLGKLPEKLVKIDQQLRAKISSDLSAYSKVESQSPLPGL